MKIVALISGGKDSCYNMLQCVVEGHEIVALANLFPQHKDELDSYMYQTVGHHAIAVYAEAMDLPLYRRAIEGSSVEKATDYIQNSQDEVEDLYQLLKQVKEVEGIEGVSVGAILSDYQRVRVENVCVRLGVTPLAFLWRREQQELLQEMLACQVKAIIIKVAALGLMPKHLGWTLEQIYPHMVKMNQQYGLNICGEGGEYETFTLDCPLFKKSIVVDEQQMVMHSDDPVCPVAYLNLTGVHTEDKKEETLHQESLAQLPTRRSQYLMRDLFGEESEDSTWKMEEEHKRSHLEERHHVCEECEKNRRRGESFSPRLASHCKWVFVSGVVGLITDGSGIQLQTKAAMHRLKDCLEKAGLHMSDLVAVHCYVKSMADFANLNLEYKKHFALNPPIRVCLEIELPEEVSLQLDCVATSTDISAVSSSPRRTMHVQSLSHWAPANIGPYSQAVRVNDMLFIAGQIALCPASMQLINGGIVPQCRLSIRHVTRVMQAMLPQGSLRHVLCGVCYVTDRAHMTTAQAEWNKTLQQEETAAFPTMKENVFCPVMTYVTVPTLPRSALVEWQVSLTCFSKLEMSEYEDSCSGLDIYNRMKMYKWTKPESDSVVHLSINATATSESGGHICLLAALSGMLDMLCHMLRKAGHNMKHLGCLQIFYSVKYSCSHAGLQEVFSTYTKEKCEDDGCIASFIPVSCFMDDKQLIVICH